MLVLDTGTQQDWRKAAKAEADAALRQQALAQEIWSNSITVQDDAGHDVSNLLVQMGRPMRSIEVQDKLKLINANLVFRRNPRYPELTAIYLRKNMRQLTGGWKMEEILVCGMESGILPEFSVLHKGKKKVANPELFGKNAPTREIDWAQVDTVVGETRGWRTVLLRLLHHEIITRGDVEKHFGWTPSRDSRKWAEQTR